MDNQESDRPLTVVMLSSDPLIVKSGSDVQQRMIDYGTVIEDLRVIAATIGGDREPITVAQNVVIYPTASKNKFARLGDTFRLGVNLIEQLPKSGMVISSTDPFEWGWIALRLKRRFNVCLQVQVHTDFLSPYFSHSILQRLRSRIARTVLREADVIRVVSKRIKESLVRRYRIPELKVIELPIHVDLERFERSAQSDGLHVLYPQFSHHILAVGRLHPEKHFELAIDALRDIVEEFPEVGLIIVGMGEEMDYLRQRAKGYGIIRNIIFHGYADTVPLYQSADLIMVTSDYEGYGLILIEAAAAGCPIVTTDVGVVGDVITEKNAYVCPVGDVRCLAEGAKKLLRDPMLRAAQKLKLQRDVQAKRGVTKEAYLEAYRHALDAALQ